jgi:hypothetical protein
LYGSWRIFTSYLNEVANFRNKEHKPDVTGPDNRKKPFLSRPFSRMVALLLLGAAEVTLKPKVPDQEYVLEVRSKSRNTGLMPA